MRALADQYRVGKQAVDNGRVRNQLPVCRVVATLLLDAAARCHETRVPPERFVQERVPQDGLGDGLPVENGHVVQFQERVDAKLPVHSLGPGVAAPLRVL